MKRSLAVALFLLAPVSLAAQSGRETTRLLARADSAFVRRDSVAARTAYDEVLRAEPDHSRALYQRARLHAVGSSEAIRQFQRYTELEPRDAWGFLAYGAALEEAGERAAARAAYVKALELEPRDAEMRAALARVSEVTVPSNGMLAIEPLGRLSGDSDGNRTLRTGVSAAFVVTDSMSFGGAVTRLEVSDDFTRVTGWEGTLFGEWRPRRALHVQARAGAVNIGRSEEGDESREAIWQARLRWRPEHGPALDLRARREPIASTPQLFGTPVVLTEARATVELPLMSVLSVRGMTRLGRLRDPADVNERTTWSAGPVLRFGAVELNGSYARTRYARPSSAGYFAPRSIEAVDASVYLEHYGWWPLTVALDVGGGMERITAHATVPPRANVPGEWERALHAWSQVSWAFAARSELRLELDAYDTRVGEVVAVAPAGWRSGSVALSLSWRP